MAKLSAHGQNIQIEYLVQKIAVCSDGCILRNTGDGWKLYKKIQPGKDWREVAAKRREKLAELHRDRPAYSEYALELMRWKLADRRRILTTMELLGDDTDGAWSELTGHCDRIDIDLDELETISRLKIAAEKEKACLNVQAATVVSTPAPPPAPPSALDRF